MQAQARPPPPQEKYTPPTAPHVPITAVQSLIPRLATAINDIDGLKAQLAAGNVDGTMPSWDVLLQRYAMLLGRVQALSTYISQPPRPTGPSVRPRGPGALAPGQAPVPAAPAPVAGPSTGLSRPGAPDTPTPDAPAQPPALAHYLVHPLRALPPDAGPLAGDTFFQAINTQALPAVQAAHAALLGDGDDEGAGGGAGAGAGPGAGAGAGTGAAQAPTSRLEALSHLDDAALARLTTDLRTRLAREAHRAHAMAREISRREDEYDWTLRLGDEDEDDLFGGHDDDDDVVMVDDEGEKEKEGAQRRQGWSVGDYLRLMDTGRMPVPPAGAAGTQGAGAGGAGAGAGSA